MSSPAVCVICGDLQTEEAPLMHAPCRRHHVCPDDLEQFFRQATKDESQYPPSCCDAPFMLTDYDEHLPFEVSWEYQIKEHGEYSVQKKFRIYCANPCCAKFLRPDSHITDSEHQVTYAICEDEACGKVSCVTCKTVLANGVAGHVCEVSEAEKLFKDTAKKEGYQECYACGSTVELAEACNHMSCGCGNDFCYICGKPWAGLHGCPHYGPAVYDEEGYNQDGYHRETELNREGLTRRQQQRQDAGDEDEEENEEEFDGVPPWATDEFREFLRQLPQDLWEDAIDQEETQRIERGEFFVPPPPPVDPLGDGEDVDGEGDDESENDEEEHEDVDGDPVEDMDARDVLHEIEDAASVVEQNKDQEETVNEAPNEGNVMNGIAFQQPRDLNEIEDILSPFTAVSNNSQLDDMPSNDNWEPNIDPIRTINVQPSVFHTNPQVLNADGPITLDTYSIYEPRDLSPTPPGSPKPLWHVISTPNARITGYTYTPPQSAEAQLDFSSYPETPRAEFSGSEPSNSLPAPRSVAGEIEVDMEDGEDGEDGMQIDGGNAKPLAVPSLPRGLAGADGEVDMHEAGRSMPGAW